MNDNATAVVCFAIIVFGWVSCQGVDSYRLIETRKLELQEKRCVGGKP